MLSIREKQYCKYKKKTKILYFDKYYKLEILYYILNINKE